MSPERITFTPLTSSSRSTCPRRSTSWRCSPANPQARGTFHHVRSFSQLTVAVASLVPCDGATILPTQARQLALRQCRPSSARLRVQEPRACSRSVPERPPSQETRYVYLHRGTRGS